MAARLNPRNDQRARDSIQTTQLVKRLQAFALSEPDKQTGLPTEMSKERVAAALGLLRKTLPDLATTTIQGDDEGGPVKMNITVAFKKPEA